MNHYELVFIISGAKTENELPIIKDRIESFITGAHAIITRSGSLGKQKLAYPIRHEHFGHYFVTEFDMEGENVRTIREKITLDEDVLRHTIIEKPVSAVGEEARETRVAAPEPMQSITDGATETPAPAPVERKAVDLGELDKKLDELLEKSAE
jgi:ribosomal protein S6